MGCRWTRETTTVVEELHKVNENVRLSIYGKYGILYRIEIPSYFNDHRKYNTKSVARFLSVFFFS